MLAGHGVSGMPFRTCGSALSVADLFPDRGCKVCAVRCNKLVLRLLCCVCPDQEATDMPLAGNAGVDPVKLCISMEYSNGQTG